VGKSRTSGGKVSPVQRGKIEVNRHILLIGHNADYLPLAPYNMGLHLSKRGYRVSLLLPGQGFSFGWRTQCVNDAFTLYFSPTLLGGPFRRGLDPLDLITKLYLITRVNCDVVFLFDSRPTVILPGVFSKKLNKVPLIIYWTDWFGRDGIIAERSGKLYRFLFERIETFFEEGFNRFADSYAVISPTLETRLRGLGYKKKVVFLPTGCNTSPVKGYDVKALRKELALPSDIPLVGCVGSLYPSDAKLAFASISLLRETMNMKLVLIGTNIYRNRYEIPKDVIETHALTKDHLYKYIGACDLMLMPLRKSIANNGRWPSKLNDYLIMGKPVVATDICIVSELFKVAKFGEIANDEPGDFADKIQGLMRDKQARDEYSSNAYRLAANVLSWAAVVDKVDLLISETLSSVGKA
jgi:glycosyltransferase involved in cell wall biosynthesis